jgi:hypothetical protein
MRAKAVPHTHVREAPDPARHDAGRLDCGRAKPNRFAGKMSKGVVAVVLEPDVAVVFNSSESVNALLRSVIAAMPESKHTSG